MKNFLSFLFLIIFTAGISAQKMNECALGKQAYFQKYNILNQVKYPGDKAIDITYYKLDLTISYSPRQIRGKVTIEGKSTIDNLTDFFLDFQNNLQLDSVLYRGTNINSSHSSDKIFMVLGDTLQPGETFSVDVYYHGIPGSSGFGSFEFSTHNGQPIIWTLSEPYGASDWFPVKDTPADKADSSDVWLRVPSGLVGVSNGTLEEVINNGDGTKTYKWKNHYPIAQYLISLAITNYELYTSDFIYNDGKDTMKVTHYVFPESLSFSAKKQLDETVKMLRVFSDKFGIYPFYTEKYGHAQFLWGGGMEHQTITSLVSFGRSLISHELAHQWFGDMITCKDWHHIWLNEGFATYLEAVYLEATSGMRAYKDQMQNEMRSAKNAKGSIWVRNINSEGQIFNGSRTYAKGAVVLHMLRGIVGTDKFYEIMKTYANTPELKYGVATTEDFQTVAEQVSGLDLNYFFQEWIYGELYPIYTVEWGYSNLGNNRFRVNFNIIQENRGKPKYFSMPVQIKVSTSAGDSTFTVFTTGKANESFSIELEGQPSRLELDPNDWILKELRSVTLTLADDENITPDKFSLEQNYPNPFNPTTTIKFSIPKIQGSENQFVKLTVFDLLGNEVKTLVNQPMQAGKHSVEFNADNLSSGVYFYSLKYGGLQQTKKMILLQ